MCIANVFADRNMPAVAMKGDLVPDPVLEMACYQKCFHFLYFHCSAKRFCDNDNATLSMTLETENSDMRVLYTKSLTQICLSFSNSAILKLIK